MKRIIYILLYLCISDYGFGQFGHMGDSVETEPKKRFRDKVYFGGGLGLQFGNVIFANVAPLVGYRFTDQFSAGFQITYSYIEYRDFDYSTSIYGGSIFSRYRIIEQVFLHAEYELLNLEAIERDPVLFTLTTRRINVPALFLGGGYSVGLGGRSFFNIMLLWEVLEHPFSPYRNPIFRGGITLGF